jgi:hypothetical protein
MARESIRVRYFHKAGRIRVIEEIRLLTGTWE